MTAPTAPAPPAPTTATTAPAKTEARPHRLHDPFEFLDDLQQEMARLWEQRPFFPRPIAPRAAGAPAAPMTAWAPRLDVYEKDGHLTIKAELPGIKKEDIQIFLDDGDLVIDGERKGESEVKEESYYRMERSYGRFYRRLPLPGEVKAEQIQATYKDGVLEVQIPQTAPATPPAQNIAVH